MTRPLLLLDIDGTLSPFLAPGEAGAGLLWWVTITEGVDPRLPVWLEWLGEAYEMVWATTWEGEANTTFGPRLGVALPWIEFRGAQVKNKTFKLASVLEYVGTRPFAWIDDDLKTDAFKAVAKHGLTAKLVKTKRREGITSSQVAELLEFARSLNPASMTP